jgi:surface antigen
MSIFNLIKGLLDRFIKISAWLAQKLKNLFSLLYKNLRFVFSPELLKKSGIFVDRFLVARRKSVKFFKRPVSDISHLSIVAIICLALLSGFSASLGTKAEVKVNLLESSAPNRDYSTKMEKRALEADTVATLAGIHSEGLGADAITVAEDLYKTASTFSPSNEYVMAQPVVQIDSVSNAQNAVTKYIVQDGDTLWSIARKFNLTTDTVRYANGIEDESFVKPGVELVILPTVGVLHTVGANDTISGIASRYGANEAMIIAQNDLYGEELVSGMKIMVPDADIPAAPKPQPTAPTQTTTNSRTASSGSAPSYVASSSGPNRFPYGYCTWWVAHKRNIPWNGNAWQWYGNAQSYGRSVGRTPVPGAVLVTWESSVGHVAYVESVNSDGSFTVSEMNYRGWGVASTRTVTTGSVPLIGFVY